MQDNDMESSITRCQGLVQDAMRELERTGRWTLADGLSDVVARLFTLVSGIRQQNQELSTIRQRLAAEKPSAIEAQRQERTLLAKVSTHQDTVNKQLATIRGLQLELQTAKKDAKARYRKGFEDGENAEKQRLKQPDGDFEDLIRRQLAMGNKKFLAHDFAVALPVLKEAQDRILALPAARRQLFDNTRLRYQIAICGAYVNDLDASEKSLSHFVEMAFPSASSKEDMLNLAHAQHLLAQVYIGQNRIQDAQNVCQMSNKTRWQYLSSSDNRRYQSAALSAKILELQGEKGASLLREAIHDSSTRDVLKAVYSKLKPVKEGSTPNNEPYVLSPPATELLPIWTMSSTKRRNADGQQKPKKPKPYAVLDAHKRRDWLSQLKLSNADGQHLDSSLEQAIRSGDKQKVYQILTTLRPRPVAPALHIAALCNEVDIARLLIQHGADSTGPCAAKSDDGKNLHGVLPMHCAVGAQNVEMIRFLHSQGANFTAAKRLGDKRVSAPPLWLVSERWLTLTGKDDAASVLKVVDLMKSLGWEKGDPLNKERLRMEDLVRKKLGSRPVLRKALLDHLQTM